MTSRPPLGTIASAAAIGAAIGGAAGAVLALMRHAPVVPFALWGAFVVGLVFPVIIVSMLADLRIARLGSVADKRARAMKPKRVLDVASTRAAVAIEAGELNRATELMAQIPEGASKDGQVLLV